MGRDSRVNPNTTAEAQRRLQAESQLRAMLNLFPDRATYERWMTSRTVDTEHAAHMEQFLPPRLQVSGGTV